MADFQRASLEKESRRLAHITRAIEHRFVGGERFMPCARCGQEFRELDNLGRRECIFHPEPYNMSAFADEQWNNPHDKAYHHSCCGWATASVKHDDRYLGNPAQDTRMVHSGCTRCEHVERIPAQLPHSGRGMNSLTLDPSADTDAYSDYVRMEPIFVLRQIAERRGIDIGNGAGIAKLLGASNVYVGHHPSCIGTSRQEMARFRIGNQFEISVPIRAAYVRMLQRYGLPWQILDREVPSANAPPGQGGTDLLKQLFPRDMSAIAPDGSIVVSEKDTMRNIMSSEIDAAGDVYYDVHPSLAADGSALDTRQRERGDVDPSRLSAADLALYFGQRLAGKSEKDERFYPFCIWLTCDSDPVMVSPNSHLWSPLQPAKRIELFT